MDRGSHDVRHDITCRQHHMVRFDRKPVFKADGHGRGGVVICNRVGLQKAGAALERDIKQTARELHRIGIGRVPRQKGAGPRDAEAAEQLGMIEKQGREICSASQRKFILDELRIVISGEVERTLDAVVAGLGDGLTRLIGAA